MAVNKVEVNGETKLDLTQDTVTPENLLSGATAHNAAGERIVGAVAPVRYDVAQNLTSEQQKQARDNIGAASLGANGKVPASQLPEISSVKTYTATIGTMWVEDSNTGVKTQTVAIAGVKSTNTATVDHVYTGAGTSDDYAAFVEAENQYLTCITNGYAETYDGGIKFTIFGDANTVSIPIVAEVS